jgi:hypothetical protein
MTELIVNIGDSDIRLIEQILALKRIKLNCSPFMYLEVGCRLHQGCKSTRMLKAKFPHLVLVARTLVWKELGLEKPIEIL